MECRSHSSDTVCLCFFFYFSLLLLIQKLIIITVDGLDPLKGAKRMVNWLQRPLDAQPPAFATVDGESRDVTNAPSFISLLFNRLRLKWYLIGTFFIRYTLLSIGFALIFWIDHCSIWLVNLCFVCLAYQLVVGTLFYFVLSYWRNGVWFSWLVVHWSSIDILVLRLDSQC